MYCAKQVLCYYERLNNKLPNAHMHCLAILVARGFAETPLILETVDPLCGIFYFYLDDYFVLFVFFIFQVSLPDSVLLNPRNILPSAA